MILLSALCLAVYFNSIHGGFVFDDSSLVQTDDRIQKLENIPRMLNPFSPSYLTYRPVRSISYAIDYYFSGYDPIGYHISNIVYHALTTFLVYLIGLRLLNGWIPALVAAALFAVHPIHTEAVAYVSGRRDVLSTLFFLLGFYWFVKSRQTQRPQLMLGVFVAYVLGVLSKEMAITLPAVMLLYDWYVELKSRPAPSAGRRPADVFGSLWAALYRRKFLYGPLFFLALFFVYYYLFVTPASTNLRIYWGGSLLTNFLTTGKIFAKYLQLMVWPVTLVADYNSGQVFELAYSLFEPIVLLSLLVVGGAVAGCVWLLQRDPTLAFGGLFFFITLLPVAHIIPHHELLSEHFLYLPSAGLCLMAGRLSAAYAAPGRLRQWSYVGVCVVLVLFGWRTVVRNRDWADEFTLWQATLRDAPLSVRAHTNVGLVYLARKEADQAIEHFQKSLSIPSKPELGNLSQGRALQNLGVAYMEKKDYDRALECFQKCLELDPNNYVSYLNMGVVHNYVGKNREAVELYKKALAINPSSKETLLNLAAGYTRLRELPTAIEHYERLIQLDRGTDFTARAHFSMGIIYHYYLNDYERAAYHLEIARRMNPAKYPTERWLGTPVNAERIETPPDADHQPPKKQPGQKDGK